MLKQFCACGCVLSSPPPCTLPPSRPGLNYSAVDVGTLTAHVGLLASYGLSIDLSVSLTANVSGLIAVMAASPNAIFVLDHMGYVPVGASPAQVRVRGSFPRSRGPKISEGVSWW